MLVATGDADAASAGIETGLVTARSTSIARDLANTPPGHLTATDMAVVYILTRGGPFNSTQMLPMWAFQTGIQAGSLGQGAAIALFLLPVLAVVTVLMLLFARRVEVT